MAEARAMHYVYFLKSIKNNKVYVGFTSKNPTARLEEHNAGSNIWTKANGPFKLIYHEEYLCEADARKRESFYKMGFGKKIKQAIISTLDD
ncbi:MAG: GIY-YIG nuclease family protein [Patescibacteria group bacterium]